MSSSLVLGTKPLNESSTVFLLVVVESDEAQHADRVSLSNENRAEKSARLKCNIVANYQAHNNTTRTAAEAESRPKGGCCNRRLSGLMGDVAKIYFQAQSHSKHEYLRSKQQPTTDKSAEAQHADRVPLSNKNRAEKSARLKCHIVADYRTVVDDLLKFVEFIDWLHDNYPELLPLHSKSL